MRWLGWAAIGGAAVSVAAVVAWSVWWRREERRHREWVAGLGELASGPHPYP